MSPLFSGSFTFSQRKTTMGNNTKNVGSLLLPTSHAYIPSVKIHLSYYWHTAGSSQLNLLQEHLFISVHLCHNYQHSESRVSDFTKPGISCHLTYLSEFVEKLHFCCQGFCHTMRDVSGFLVGCYLELKRQLFLLGSPLLYLMISWDTQGQFFSCFIFDLLLWNSSWESQKVCHRRYNLPCSYGRQRR